MRGAAEVVAKAVVAVQNRIGSAGVLVTGCQSHETSADYSPTGDPADAYGALTHTLTTALRQLKERQKGGSISHKWALLSLSIAVWNVLHLQLASQLAP